MHTSQVFKKKICSLIPICYTTLSIQALEFCFQANNSTLLTCSSYALCQWWRTYGQQQSRHPQHGSCRSPVTQHPRMRSTQCPHHSIHSHLNMEQCQNPPLHHHAPMRSPQGPTPNQYKWLNNLLHSEQLSSEG